MIFTIKIQKRFADVDMLGHVNNVNLQHYFDLGKSDMFRRLIGGVEDHNSNTSLIIKATHNVYESPVFMAQDTEVTTQINRNDYYLSIHGTSDSKQDVFLKLVITLKFSYYI